MPKSRIPSPARSQGAPVTPRRQKPRTRSVGSPARSNASGRLSTVIDQFREINKDSFALSPLGKTVLNDDTDIEQPRRTSWWKRVEHSRVVSEVLDTDKGGVNNVLDELDIVVLSQEKKHYTMDLSESSDSDSISSIVIPQRKLFSQKENVQQNRYREIVNTRESLAKQNKTNIADKTATETGPKNLFNKAPKRTKPIFPAALLKFSPDKTANKTKELPAEVKSKVRNLFGNRPGTKRKNIFADFILSESEDDISEIQPKLFAFQKNSAPVRHSTARPRESSPTSSITTDIEMDDWHLLPSSTMFEQQIETELATTPGKRTRLSKLSEAKESTVANSTANKTKHSNKSASKNHGNDDLNEIAKEKTNVSLKGESKAKVDVVTEGHEKQHDNIETSEKNSNKSKFINKYVEETPEATQEENKDNVNSEEIQSIQEESKKTNQEIDQDAEDAVIEAEVHEEMEVSDHEEEGNNQVVQMSENEIETKEKQINKNNEYERKAEEIETSDDIVDDRMEGNKLEVDEQEMAEQTSKDQQIKDNKQHMDQEIEDDKQDMDQEIEDDKQGMDHEIEDNKQETAEQAIEDQEIENDEQEVDEQKIPEQAVDVQGTNDNEEEVDKQETEEQSEQEIDDEQVEEEMILQMEDDDEIENDNHEIEQEVTDNEEQNESHEVKDQNQDEENNSQEVHDQSASNGVDVENDEEDEKIESDNEEEIQNESQNLENDSQEIDDDQVENDDDEQEAEEKDSSHEEQDESRELLNESQEEEIENTSQEIQEQSDEENDAGIQSDSAEIEEENDEEILDESQAEINNESQEINDDDQEEIQNESEKLSQAEINNESQEISDIDEEEIRNESEELSDGDQEDIEQDDQEGNKQEDQQDNEQYDQEAGEQETEEPQETESETPNVSHDTTGRNRKKDLESPEAILHEVTNQSNSFTTKGRNTSIRKTKSIFKTKHSLAPVTESTRLSDGTKNSSAEGSGWDSHRTTRKTLRQTFGRDFTPRKSLRAMVMEKSAKRQTAINEANAALNLQEAANDIPPEDAQEEMDYDDNVENIEESDHEVSKRTRQTTLEMYLQKIKKENMERNLKIEEQVKNSFKFNPHRRDFLNRIPPKPIRRTAKPLQIAPKKRLKPSVISLEDLPPELVEDMKYKPPKRYQPSNACWITKRLYKFLESKLEPVYDYKARVRAEKLVEMIYNFARDTRRERVAAPHAVAELEQEMARLHIVRTHFDFYNFFHDYMPLEVKIKVVPDIVNDIPMPRNGLFGDIIDAQ